MNPLDKLYEGIFIKIPCPQCNDTGRYNDYKNGGNFRCDCQDEPTKEMSEDRFNEIIEILKPIAKWMK